MRFPLHDLTDREFEDLVGQICMEILGMGTIVFTTGRDGGRDGKFAGTANNFPSKNSPGKGKFIIQAKHTENPYSFQGDERDVIFLSMVAAPNQRIGTYASDADRRRFNVAASRAKEQMWLFHTPILNDLSQNCLRRRLLGFFIDPREFSTIPIDQDIHVLRHKALRANRQIEKPPEPFDSWFELDVALKIATRNYRVVPQYPVIEGKRIDLVVEGKLSRLAVECDGDYWHGPDEYEEDMERQRILERCGWQFFRVRGSSFYLDPDKALEGLWEMLEEMDIRPLSDENHESEPETEKSEQEKTKQKKQDNEEKKVDALKNNNNKEKIRKSTIRRQKKLFETDEGPKNIQEAQALKPAQIRKYIIDELEDRPNNSCVKDQLGGFILRRLKIRTHGKPKAQFCKKVNSSLTFMNKKKIVKIYKTSKNVRVKLL
jgi:very-short-patch-repair endonuclease